MDDQARAAFELMPTEDKARFFENMKTEMPGMVKARIKFLSNKDEVFMSIDAKDNMYGGPLMQNYLIEDLLYKDSYTGPNEEIGKLFNMLSQQDRNALGIEFQNDMARKTNEKIRSEEHTSELQSRLHLVCRLLLEKKKTTKIKKQKKKKTIKKKKK
mgnify:CR=1 FL=1